MAKAADSPQSRSERRLHAALIAIAVCGLAAGGMALLAGDPKLAGWFWAAATVPVAAALAVSIVRDLLAGRVGVDAIALLSMVAAIAFGEPLAGAVVALMYAGGNVLEDFAVLRAKHNLRALVDRAPRLAHRLVDHGVEDVPVGAIAVGDRILERVEVELNREGFPNRAKHDSSWWPGGGRPGWRMEKLFAFE